jgi:hypothetical protein
MRQGAGTPGIAHEDLSTREMAAAVPGTSSPETVDEDPLSTEIAIRGSPTPATMMHRDLSSETDIQGSLTPHTQYSPSKLSSATPRYSTR